MKIQTEITDTEKIKRGQIIAYVLKLKRDSKHHDRFQTTWGNKTTLGLYLTTKRLIEKAHNCETTDCEPVCTAFDW